MQKPHLQSQILDPIVDGFVKIHTTCMATSWKSLYGTFISKSAVVGTRPLNVHGNVTPQPSKKNPPLSSTAHVLVNTCMTMGPPPRVWQHSILIEALCIIHRQNYFVCTVPGQRELHALLLSALTWGILTIPDMCRAARVYHCPHYRPL